jgi:ATP-dependent exoDNAse (exonuclease V) alpha subunit
MVGYKDMLFCLHYALKGKGHIILIGDQKQCAPVASVGMPFSYFVNGSSIVKTELFQVHRQNIMKLKEGINGLLEVNKLRFFPSVIEHIELKDNEDIIEYLKEQTIIHRDRCIILKPCKSTKLNNEILDSITIERREKKQEVKSINLSQYYIGMPVMRRRNEYSEDTGEYVTVNGETGFVKSYTETTITIEHPNKTITSFLKDFHENYVHHYCISIEKSQGSGYDTVFLVYDNESYENKNKIYTAITRAKKRFVLISKKQNILDNKKFVVSKHQMHF